jgi:hypothetical protein
MPKSVCCILIDLFCIPVKTFGNSARKNTTPDAGGSLDNNVFTVGSSSLIFAAGNLSFVHVGLVTFLSHQPLFGLLN